MKDRIKELEAEIARLKIVEKWFGEIMAVIHGDGGHYYCDHGPIKACKDAKKKFWELVTIKESSQEMISAQGTDIINLRKRLNKAEIARDGWMKNYDLEKAALAALKAENERLKAILDRAISHIDETARGPYYIAIPRLYGELGKIFRGEEP